MGGGAGQALLLLLLLMLENDGLRSDVCLNPLTGCNGYYRPAIRTQSRFSLLYQIPAKNNKKKKNITKRKINIHTQINTKRKLIGFKPYNDVLSANVAALKRYQGT